MLGFGNKKKKLTNVADAVAPLQQIVNDLQDVANHRDEEVESKKRRIEMLELEKEADEQEASLAKEQVNKMSEFFGMKPSEKE